MFDNIENEDFSVEDKSDIKDEENLTNSENSSDEDNQDILNVINEDKNNSDNDGDNNNGGSNSNRNKDVSLDIKIINNNHSFNKNKKYNNNGKNINNKKYNYPKKSDFIFHNTYFEKNFFEDNIKRINLDSGSKFKFCKPKKRNYITMIMQSKDVFGFDESNEQNIIKKFSFPKLLKSNYNYIDFNNMMSKLNIK